MSALPLLQTPGNGIYTPKTFPAQRGGCSKPGTEVTRTSDQDMKQVSNVLTSWHPGDSFKNGPGEIPAGTAGNEQQEW